MNGLSAEEQLKAKIQVIVNFFNTSNYEEVVRRTIPLIKKFPNIYVLNNLLALAYNASEKYKPAIKTLEDALKFDSQNIYCT